MFTKRYGKQLVATCYASRGNTIINEDRFVVSGCSKLERVIQSRAFAGQM